LYWKVLEKSLILLNKKVYESNITSYQGHFNRAGILWDSLMAIVDLKTAGISLTNQIICFSFKIYERCSGRVSSSCSICGTRRVTNPVINHE
jgi:hypothetical protein